MAACLVACDTDTNSDRRGVHVAADSAWFPRSSSPIVAASDYATHRMQDQHAMAFYRYPLDIVSTDFQLRNLRL